MERFDIVKEKDQLGRILAKNGPTTGDIWFWCTNIRGLKNGLITAQLGYIMTVALLFWVTCLK